MNSAIALRENVLEIHQLLIEAQECLKIVEYLRGHDPEADVYAKTNNTFWRMTASIYTDYAILKLNIVFDPTEHFSISRLLKSLDAGEELEGHIPENKLLLWRKELGKLGRTYKSLQLHRNKRIAHKDKDFEHSQFSKMSWGEIKNVIGTTQNILDQIIFLVFGETLEFDIVIRSGQAELKRIIRDLDQFRREELRPLFDEAKKYGLDEELPPSER